MIPQDFIQSLLARVDIVDVVDRHVKLKKAGSNFQACCPFHNEKTPSFTVSPSKQFYHCFGCGAHGNAIGFLMEYQGLAYPEAIRALAETVGMQVPETRARQERSSPASDPGLPGRMLEALNYYRAQLKKAKPAIDYLKGRGLSGEIAARYGIGFAPDGWQNLEAVFTDYGGAQMKDTGLVIDSDPRPASETEGGGEKKSRRYDRFRNRVMFPILDARGNVIGFGGRVIGPGEPKYLNSPETPLFEKGRELYGLYQARRAIRDANQVLVVEGYMDVVALAQHGVENAVATLGTATTPHHLAKLLRLADNVIFCFDGDNAGRKAAWRALEVSLPVLNDGKVVSFLFLLPEDDPDTFVRREGREAFQAAVALAKPLSQFLFAELTSAVDMGSEEGRARLVAQAKPLLEQVGAPALGAMLRRRLAELAHLAPGQVDALIPSALAKAVAPPQPGRPARRRPPSIAVRLMALLVNNPALVHEVPPEELESIGAESTALKEVSGFFRQDSTRTAAQASAYFEGTQYQALLSEAVQEPLLKQAESPDFDDVAEVHGIVDRLRQARLGRRKEELLARRQAGTATAAEEAEYADLLSRLAAARAGGAGPEASSKI